jgi:hypothetical protein
MSMTKPRSGERGLRRWPASVAVAAGPNEIVAFAVLALDHAGVDRAGKLGSSSLTERYSRRVLQAAPNSVAPAKMRKSGPRSLSPSVGTNFKVLTSRVMVLTAPVKPAEPLSFLVKVPMVAIVVFIFVSGRAYRGLI